MTEQQVVPGSNPSYISHNVWDSVRMNTAARTKPPVLRLSGICSSLWRRNSPGVAWNCSKHFLGWRTHHAMFTTDGYGRMALSKPIRTHLTIEPQMIDDLHRKPTSLGVQDGPKLLASFGHVQVCFALSKHCNIDGWLFIKRIKTLYNYKQQKTGS